MNEYDEWSLEEMYLQEADEIRRQQDIDRMAEEQDGECPECGGWGYDKHSGRMASCAACGGTGERG